MFGYRKLSEMKGETGTYAELHDICADVVAQAIERIRPGHFIALPRLLDIRDDLLLRPRL